MNVFYVQLATLLSLLVGNLLVGLLPLSIVRTVGGLSCSEHFAHRRNGIVTFLLVCGGGVLMSTCFLVLLPESRKHFENNEEAHQSNETSCASQEETFPFPEFIVLCGFFVTFALEELLHYILYHFQLKKANNSNVRVRFCSCAKRHTECSRTFKADLPDQTLFGLEKNNAALGLDYSAFSRPTEPATNMSTNLLQSQVMPNNYGSVADGRTNTPCNIPTPTPMITDDANVVIVQNHNVSSDTHMTSNILLLIALSCHAVLQGIDIGLTPSTPWTLPLVLCLQQAILVFIVGSVGLSNTSNLATTLSFVATISIMSPVGIGITMLMDDELRNELVFGIIKGLLCGSLLYFTFYDLLRRRTLKAAPHLSRFVGFSMGAVVVAVLIYILGIL